MKNMKLISLIGLLLLGGTTLAQVPTVTIGIPSTSIANSTTEVTFTITYTSATSVTLDNTFVSIAHTETSGGSITVTGSGTETRSVIISGISGDGSYTVSINAGSSSNGEGSDTGAGPSAAVTVDNTPPTAAIGAPSATPVNSTATVDFTVTYSGSTSVALTSGMVSINHTGTSGGSVAIENGTTATPTVKVSGVDGNGSYTISIAGGAASDDASNTDTGAGPSAAVTVDNTPPTATITYDLNRPVKAGELLTITATFSEDMADSPIPQISMSGVAVVAATNMNKTNATSYYYTYTVPAGDGVQSVFLNTGKDLAGNVVDSNPSSGGNFTIDNTAPTLSPVKIYSSNAEPAYAKVGDVVTLEFDADEAIQTPVVKMPGTNTADININDLGSNQWKAEYTMKDTDTEGDITFTIEFVDIAGNLGSDVSSTTNESNVEFVKSAPTLSNAYMVSNHLNSGWAKVGNRVTLTFTSGVNIKNINVTIAGENVTGNLSATQGKNFNTYFDMVTGKTQGVIPFAITYTNMPGTPGDPVNQNSGVVTGVVQFDETPPTITPVEIYSNHSNTVYARTGSLITVDFTSSELLENTDEVTKVDVQIAGGSATISDRGSNMWRATYLMTGSESEVTIPFLITVYDLAGNSQTKSEITLGSNVVYDKTNPTIDNISITSNNTRNHLAKIGNLVTLTFESSELLDINTVTAKFGGYDADNISNVGNTWTATRTITGVEANGSLPIIVNYKDMAGNEGVLRNNTTDATSVNIDKTPPTFNTLTIKSDNSDNSNPTVAIVGDEIKVDFTADETIENITVTIGGKPATVYNITGNRWAAFNYVDTDFPEFITFNLTCYDLAGNEKIVSHSQSSVATTDEKSVSYDSSPPSISNISIVSNNSTINTLAKVGDVVTITFTSSEALGDTDVLVYGTNPASVSNTGNSWTATYTMRSDDANGIIPFAITYYDLAGNSGEQKTQANASNSVTFDKTPPTFSSVSIMSSNAASGLAKVGNLITLSFTSSEVVTITSASISGNTVVPSSAGDAGLDWTATYTMQNTDNNGTIPFVIDYKDVAGNPGATVTATTDATSVVFDKTAPSKPGTPDLAEGSDSNINNDNITSVLKPTFSGSAEPNCTISIYSSVSGLLQTANSDANGDWSLPLTSVLTEVTHGIYVTATDAAGNVSVASNSLSVTIDYTAPDAPLSLDLDAASDTGISDSDYITSDNTPTIKGTAEVGSTVRLYSGTTLLGSAVADGTGNWSITSSTLVDGTYNLTAKATDVAGNISDLSVPLGITIDTQAPAKPSTPDLTSDLTSDTGASNTDNITSNTTPEFQVTAEAGSTIRLYSNVEGGIGIGVTDGTGTWALTASTALSEGNHSITATATDVAGNVSLVSAALSITIDITPPAAPSTPDMDSTSDSGTSNSDNNTNVVRPTFTGTAETYSAIELFSDIVGSEEVGVGIANMFGIWSITTTSDLAHGSHIITAKATDVAGNVSDVSGGLTITIDTEKPATPPTPVIDPASNTGSTADNITADTTPSFTGTAEEDAIVKLYVDGFEKGSVIATGGTWSITTTTLTDGAKSITVTATDLAGNVSDESTALVVIIDATAPTAPSKPDMTAASDTGISNADNITSNKTPEFTGSAEVSSVINLYSNLDGLIGSTTANATTGEWTITASALTEGNHNITATATDAAANVSPVSAALSITIDITDPAAPIITGITEDTGASNSDGVTKDNTPTVQGTSEANALIKIFVDALTYETTANSSGVWNYTLSTLADGEYAITAMAIDAAGNESDFSSGFTIKIDTAIPNAPSITGITDDTGRDNADGITSDQTLVFNGTSDANAFIDVYIGGALVGSTTADGSGSWSYDHSSTTLAAGSRVITARATDNAGNISVISANYPVVIDITVPNAPTVTSIFTDTGLSNSDGITSDQTLIFNGTSEANALVEIFVDGVSVETVLASEAGVWSFDYTGYTFPESSYIITAKATDVAGNISSVSTNYPIVIDRTQPTVSLSDNHPDAIVRHGDLVTITATFTEAHGIDEANKPRITIEGLVTNAEMTMASNLIWRYVWIVPSGTDVDVEVSITARDVAGNANTPATGKTSYKVDNTQPTVVLTDNHDDAIVRHGDVVTITATFSENVNTPKITIGGLVLSQNMAGADKIWTYTWNVPADFNGTVNVSISATDIAGNANTSAAAGVDGTTSYTVDNVSPTVVLSDNHTDAIVKNSDVVTITATFTENVNTPKITIGGLMLTEDMTGADKVWTYSWIVPADHNGSVGVSISTTDIAGNANAAATGKTSYTVDNTPPTVELSDNHPDAIVRHGDVVTITATFIEAYGIDEGSKPRITIGTLVEDAEMTMASNLIWRYVWTVPAGEDKNGDVTVSIAASDVAGNANTPATGKTSYKVDNTQPTVVLTDNHDDAIVRHGDVVTITATFSETVIAPKITIGNLVLSQNMSGAGAVWTYTWNVPAEYNGTVGVSISATDISGNASTAATAGVDGTTSYKVDNVSPTVVLSDNHTDAIVKDGDVIIITATFTEANGINEVSKPHITIGSNTFEMLRSTNLVWTYEWTVSESSDGIIALSISAADVAGNTNTVATGKTAYTVDNTVPAFTSVSISSNYSNSDKAKAGSVITINFTASETIQNVAATILGNAAAVSNVAGNLWKANYAVIGDETAEGVDKVVVFQVDFEDVAGNSASASNIDITDGSSVTLDITKPMLNPVTIYSDHTPHIDRARIGSLITVQFISNEAIEGVSVTINSVNASVEPVAGHINTWRANYYMRSVDIHGSEVSFAINYKDLAGNAGNQQVSVTDESKVVFDKVKPTFTQVSIYSNNTTSTAYSVSGNTVFIEFTTSEDVETPSVTINGVAATSITGGPTAWVASRVMIAGESEGVIPFTIDVEDLAGNESLTRFTATNASRVILDDQEPNITAISVASGVYKVGDIVSVFIQADNNSYVGVTVEVNGKNQSLINNNNNTYSINYLVEEGDVDVVNSGSLPVNIVLRDNAGNIATRLAAVTTSGSITVDANTPQIQTVTSSADIPGSLVVGDQVIFSVSPIVAEEGLLINPSTYNTKPISWSTTDGGVTYTATYTVQEGDPTRETPLQLGTVTITDQAGNISTSYSYTQIEKSIYATSPTALIEGTITKCDYGQLVPVRFEFTGYAPFQLQFSDGVDVFDVADIDDYFYEIQVERGAFTLVKLTDAKGNFTTTALQNAIITVNPLPTITLNILGSPFNVNEQRILLTDFATPAGGLFSGDGVSTVGYFYPNMIELEGNEKVVPITYTYTNAQGCTNSATQNVVVSTGGAYIEGFSATSIYCQYSKPFEVEGRNPSSIVGRFSLSGMGISRVLPNNNFLTIDPGELNAGDYNLKYEYDDGGTTFAASKTFTIDSVGSQIDFGQLLDQYCADAGVVSLQATGLFPLGGTGYFTGPTPGFNPATAVFEPSKVVKFDEIYTITYHYITPLGCSSDTIRKNVRVNSLPVINFTLRDNYNFDEEPVTLTGVPGGAFSDNQGIIVNNILYPSRTTPGFINVTLNYTQDATGCSNTLTKQTRIRKATETIQGLGNVYCYSNDTLDISTQVVDDATIVGQFYSAKGAIVSTGVNSARYSIVDAGNGNDVITFKYTVGSTPYEINKTVLIDSIGPVTITNLLESYCADARPVSISGYLDNPPQGSRTISYSGTIAAFDVASGGIATLSPSLETPGNYAVTFKFTSAQSGCSRDTTYGLTIHPLPVVVVDFPEYYSIDAEPLPLEGTPAGGTFSAQRGVSGNEFLPALAGPGLMTITYRVQDVHGCVNTAQDGVTVVGADAAISGLPTFTCIDSQPFTVTGSSNNGLAGEFVGKGIREKQDNSAVFDPVEAGKGIHTITYKYLFEGDATTELFITRNIEVDSLGIVEFFELENQYCFNNAGKRISALPVGGTFKVENYLINNVFNPGNARTDTLNPITYTLTNPVSGCSIKGVKDVVVNPVPEINFFLDDPCSDLSSEPVRFKNTTTSVDPVVEWMWRFEKNGSITSDEFEPSYIYSTSGSKEVTLMAKTDKDCSIERTSIVYVGLIPKATFSWRNECLTGEETVFTSTSDPTNLVRYRWVFDSGTTLDGGVNHRSVNHTFDQVGNHNVEMVIESGDGCLDTIQKQVLIQPYIKLADLPNMVYFDNFEGEEITWDARPIVENQFSSWLFGSPTGSVINTAASGSKAWYTQVDNQQIERSQVLSPCFDLRSLEKPMLKFNLWSSSYQGRDGAVLQYDLDGNNVWTVLGEIGDGINWYNNTIESLPGDQLLGWSHTSMTNWVSARISLDEIKDAPNVRFRIAYATNKFFNPTPYDGIAFDDFWIGNREQNLLLEYFTNATLAQTAQPNSDMVNLEQQNSLDIVPIHYHTSSPSGDPMHSLFAPGIASRQFFYGISAIPYALVNGLQPFGFASFGQNQTIVNVEQLKDPEMAIALSGSAGSSINLSVDVTALAPINNQELVLHAVLTQKEYIVDEAINGQSSFFNVVRGFIPGPAGTTLPSNWSAGQMETFHINGQLPSGVSNGELSAVIFVQNIQTRRVYQVGVVDVGSITSAGRPNEPFTVNLFPNPATTFVRLVSPRLIEQATLLDVAGRTIRVVNPHSQEFDIPVNDLKPGLYLVRFKSSTGYSTTKFIKQ